MDPDQQAPARGRRGRQTFVGACVVVWAFLDPVIGIALITLAAWLRPLVVFLVAAVVLTVQLAGQIVGILCGRAWQEA
jgi:hypothetical protein